MNYAKDRPSDGDDFALLHVVRDELHLAGVTFDDDIVVACAGTTVAKLLSL